jgi:hypothetical protein
MIEHQNRPVPEVSNPDMANVRQGAEILRLTLAYEQLIHRGKSRTEAAHLLSSQNKQFSPDFFSALVTLDPNAEEGDVRKCRIELLSPGMIVQEEIRTFDGALVLSTGQEVTPPLILKLKNLQARRAIGGTLTISSPKTTLSFVKGA